MERKGVEEGGGKKLGGRKGVEREEISDAKDIYLVTLTHTLILDKTHPKSLFLVM